MYIGDQIVGDTIKDTSMGDINRMGGHIDECPYRLLTLQKGEHTDE
jgi:hypothetical protein